LKDRAVKRCNRAERRASNARRNDRVVPVAERLASFGARTTYGTVLRTLDELQGVVEERHAGEGGEEGDGDEDYVDSDEE
jgi:hypothetical protein